ncbi:alpha/beta hydrolase fold domain-containing protein [Lolliginicoccus suaedae]|uniref:alpha/beta hydrolase fold domain-containing protein n=1 Tax=Lolliginicoccus suaedae TaxID=2605429 RepID=UPI0011EECE70|nr:alpha/beta hydrolase [Lolliginicoccus suaedae]
MSGLELFTSLALLMTGAAILALAVNALWPRTSGRSVIVSWPAAWLAIELPVHVLLGGTIAVIVLVAVGGIHPLGMAGLVLFGAGAAFLARFAFLARTAAITAEPPLPEVARGHGSGDGRAYPGSHVLLPWLPWRRRDIKRINNVVYSRHGNLALKLDITLPRDGEAPPGGRPAIIQVHGGGWTVGTRKDQAIPLLTHLAANGWVGFNIDYRLSPRSRWPDHIVDVKQAIAWVREHASEYGIDPGFITITGGSAGGHLCALAALTPGDPRFQPGFEDADTSVAACVPFYGVYDLLDEDRHHFRPIGSLLQRNVFRARRKQQPDLFRAASPLHRITADAPPFLVIHGDRDSLVTVEEGRGFARMLREKSREPAYYVEVRGGQHSFDVLPSWRTVRALAVVEQFLRGSWEEHRRRQDR